MPQQPGRENSTRAAPTSAAEHRQPDRGQKRLALKARMVFFHASMIPMNPYTLPRLGNRRTRGRISPARLGDRRHWPGPRQESADQDLFGRWRRLPAIDSSSSCRPAPRDTGSEAGGKVTFAPNRAARAEGLSSSVRRGHRRPATAQRCCSCRWISAISARPIRPADCALARVRRCVVARSRNDGGRRRVAPL